ncbi:MAG: SAM-dependent methyltransferase, partial [Dermatophilaceae bacterium]
YVDRDPVVASYGRAHFSRDPQVSVWQADLCDPEAVWSSPAVTDSITTSEPVGLLFVAVLHFVKHTESLEVLARYRSLLPPGSQVAISLVCQDPVAMGSADAQKALREESAVVGDRLNLNLVFRPFAEVEELFDGLTLVDPGLVPVTSWRSDEEVASMAYSASAVVQL